MILKILLKDIYSDFKKNKAVFEKFWQKIS